MRYTPMLNVRFVVVLLLLLFLFLCFLLYAHFQFSQTIRSLNTFREPLQRGETHSLQLVSIALFAIKSHLVA